MCLPLLAVPAGRETENMVKTARHAANLVPGMHRDLSAIPYGYHVSFTCAVCGVLKCLPLIKDGAWPKSVEHDLSCLRGCSHSGGQKHAIAQCR